MKTKIFAMSALLGSSALLSGCDDNELVQLDRMGRSGVNTALTDPFFRSANATETARHNSIAQAYNENLFPSNWASAHSSQIQASLGILDSLDQNCGNQLIADAATPRYSALAGVLADDRLFVNTASGTCGQYLAVEGNAVGISNTDCGGRTPLHDSIDTTYSVLAAGALNGVGDGVANDADGNHSNTTFPFLDAPL